MNKGKLEMPKNRDLFYSANSDFLRECFLSGERVKEKVSPKGDYVQMIAMRGQCMRAIAELPENFKGKTPCEIVLALITDLEQKKTFPQAHYAVSSRLLTPQLAQVIESYGKHWVGQLEGTTAIQWEGPWWKIGKVAEQLRRNSPLSFREAKIQTANQTIAIWYVFTRSVRLEGYGRKRIVIAHDTPDLSGTPLYLFTDALYWEGRRVVQMWQYRWDEHLFAE
jgi:hypothetical protein